MECAGCDKELDDFEKEQSFILNGKRYCLDCFNELNTRYSHKTKRRIVKDVSNKKE